MRECERDRQREAPVKIFLQQAQIPNLTQIIVANRTIRIRNCSFDSLLFFQIPLT